MKHTASRALYLNILIFMSYFRKGQFTACITNLWSYFIIAVEAKFCNLNIHNAGAYSSIKVIILIWWTLNITCVERLFQYLHCKGNSYLSLEFLLLFVQYLVQRVSFRDLCFLSDQEDFKSSSVEHVKGLLIKFC